MNAPGMMRINIDLIFEFVNRWFGFENRDAKKSENVRPYLVLFFKNPGLKF